MAKRGFENNPELSPGHRRVVLHFEVDKRTAIGANGRSDFNPQQIGEMTVADDAVSTVPVFEAARGDSVVQNISCRIVTFVYGGGYEAGISDTTVTPIRASGIRGQLRWWWRCTRGADAPDFRDLKRREDRIWGATERRSRVTVEVIRAQLAGGIDAKRNQEGRQHYDEPRYALFPAQSDPVRKIHKDGSFTLRVRYPEELQEDVTVALRAFFWFGGIGARTRRGLGALLCESGSGFSVAGPNFQFGGLAHPAAQPEWAVLSGSRYVIGAKMSPINAWLRAVELMKNYRQARREGQGNRPGRSYWNEPDAIRHLRNAASDNHTQRVTEGDIFPRGQLGLPIIFHFKSTRPGDPADNTLELDTDHDRMASPVILRPLVISDREAYPLCLVLNAPPSPRQFLLKQANAPNLVVEAGGFDLLEGLLQTAEQVWKTERRSL